jgi:hypothetical protein
LLGEIDGKNIYLINFEGKFMLFRYFTRTVSGSELLTDAQESIQTYYLVWYKHINYDQFIYLELLSLRQHLNILAFFNIIKMVNKYQYK